MRHPTRLCALAWPCLIVLAVLCLGTPQMVRAAEMSYQGELLRNGTPFTGTAQMKFVLCKSGVTVWSNDLSSSGCAQPTAAVNVLATNGAFAVILGGPGMQTISGPGAADLGGAALKVWANTGSGFELLPDQPLASAPTAMGVVQVDPGATGFLARWDGTKLARGIAFDDGLGHVGIGTASPAYLLDVIATGVPERAARFRNANSNITSNSTNYLLGMELSVASAIAGGVTDSGYRIGMLTQSVASGAAFAGTLTQQTGLWSQVGTVSGTTGTIGTTYAGYFQTLHRSGTINEAFGIYETSELPNSKNYFQSKVGIGTITPGSLLTVSGVIESTSGGIKFPDGTIQTSAGGGSIRTINGAAGPAIAIQGSGGVAVSTTGNVITISTTVSTCTYANITYSTGAICSTGPHHICGGTLQVWNTLTCQPDGSWQAGLSDCRYSVQSCN